MMSDKTKDNGECTFNDLLSAWLYGKTRKLPKSFDVLVHDFLIIGKTLLWLFTGWFTIVLISMQPWFSGLLKEFWNDPGMLYFAFAVIWVVLFLSSISAPATQALFLFANRKLTLKEAWGVHLFTSLVFVSYLIFAAYDKSSELIASGLSWVWGVSFSIIVIRWIFALAGKFHKDFYKTMLFAAIWWGWFSNSLVARGEKALKRKEFAKDLGHFRDKREEALKDFLILYRELHKNPVDLVFACLSFCGAIASRLFNMPKVMNALALGWTDGGHPLLSISLGIILGICGVLAIAWLAVRIAKNLMLVRVRIAQILLADWRLQTLFEILKILRKP